MCPESISQNAGNSALKSGIPSVRYTNNLLISLRKFLCVILSLKALRLFKYDTTDANPQ